MFGKKPDKLFKRNAQESQPQQFQPQQSQPQEVQVQSPNLTPAQKRAQEKYLFAKSVWEESREHEHWLYMQKCIDEVQRLS